MKKITPTTRNQWNQPGMWREIEKVNVNISSGAVRGVSILNGIHKPGRFWEIFALRLKYTLCSSVYRIWTGFEPTIS